MAGEIRWVANYAFTITERSTVQIDLRNVAGIDPYLRLLSASGTVVVEDDDGGDSTDARISQVLDSGSYKIQATKYNSAEGQYALVISIGDGNAPQPTQGATVRVRSLSVGGDHACALTDTGGARDDILCWGRDDQGQASSPYYYDPDTHGGLDLGRDYSCSWVDRRAYGPGWACWGSRTGPEIVVQRDSDDYWWPSSIGEGIRCGPYSGWSEWRSGWYVYRYCGGGSGSSRSSSATPAIVGGYHRCSLSSGRLSCTGNNDYGQRDVPSDHSYSSADAGRYHTCAVTTDSSLLCWGLNTDDQTTPPSGSNYASVYSNGFADFSCALTQEGKVTCWGSNTYGQLNVPASISANIDDTQLPLTFEQAAPRPTWERGRQIPALELPAAQGGSGDVTYRIVSRCGGAFTLSSPDGLKFDPANRVLSGTLSASVSEGPCAVYLSAIDGTGETASLDITADVRMPADFRWLSTVQSQEWTVGNAITPLELPAGTSAAGPVTYSLEWELAGDAQDGLPPGLSFDALDRRLSGTPTGEAASLSLIFRATEPTGVSIELAIPVELMPAPIVRGQIVALGHEDGRIEIGFQPVNGLRILPTRRLFPTDATVGSWYWTGPVEYLGGEIGRVRMRRLADDRVELALQSANGEWLYPTKRYLRIDATQTDNGRIRRWLKSSSLDMPLGGACTADWADPHVQQYVAQMYAPLLRFDDGEDFRPVGIEAMVGNSELHDWTEKLSGERHVPETVWNWDDTSTTWDITASNPWTLTAGRIAENTNFSLNVEVRPFEDLYDDDIYVRWWNTAKHRYDHVVYYRVVEIGEQIVLQYWLFYVWNNAHAHGWNHEGDWESVQLVFAPSALQAALCSADAATPIGGGFAQHEYGAWVESQDMQWFLETHPTVFIADGSHASYHYAGTSQVRLRVLPDLLVHDSHKADAPDLSLAPANLMSSTGVLDEYVLRPLDERWATWPGLWGKRDGATKTGHWAPQGPAFKAHYNVLPCAIEEWDGARQPRSGEALVVSC